MRLLGAFLGLLLLCSTAFAQANVKTGADPCFGAFKSSAAISVTSGTTTSVVAAVTNQIVFVCGFSITIAPSATAADTALFEYGTGAACASTQTVLTGTFGNGDLTAATGVATVTYGGAGHTIFTAPVGNAICIVTAGTAVNVQGVMTYVQGPGVYQ